MQKSHFATELNHNNYKISHFAFISLYSTSMMTIYLGKLPKNSR